MEDAYQRRMTEAYQAYAAQPALARLAEGRRLVPGYGPLDAPLMVVGEAPGEQEEKQGRPFCLVPWHLVLMADLTWKQLGDIEVGDQLLAPDEYGPPQESGASGSGLRRWRIATVTNVMWSNRPVQRVATDVGDLIGTADHRVLTCYANTTSHLKRWLPIGSLVQGTSGPRNSGSRSSAITWVGSPWKTQQSWEAGWVSGFFDGEGHVANRAKIRVGYAQNVGPVQEKAERLIAKAGFQTTSHGDQEVNGVTCSRSYIAGGSWETFRFLGEIRPDRLIANARRTIAETPPALRGGPARVSVREKIRHEMDVVDITTTTGTFIADGFVVHNCGPSGKLLQKIFEAADLWWACCYVTNVVPWRPPGNRTPYPFEVQLSQGRLAEEVSLVDPVVIVAAGDVAWRCLTRNEMGPFAEARFRWHDLGGRRLVAVPHPSALLRLTGAERTEWLHQTAGALAQALPTAAP